MTEEVTVADATDTAFVRKYQSKDPATKDKIRRMLDLLDDDE